MLEENGGDDGTRTRGLCRDRVAFRWNSMKQSGTDNPLAESRGIDYHELMDPDWTRFAKKAVSGPA